MNINFPSKSKIQSALWSSIFFDSSIVPLESYLRNLSFDENNNQVIDGYIIYKCYDHDNDEVLFMITSFSFRDDKVELGLGVEPNVFKSFEEASKHMQSYPKTKLFENYQK